MFLRGFICIFPEHLSCKHLPLNLISKYEIFRVNPEIRYSVGGGVQYSTSGQTLHLLHTHRAPCLYSISLLNLKNEQSHKLLFSEIKLSRFFLIQKIIYICGYLCFQCLKANCYAEKKWSKERRGCNNSVPSICPPKCLNFSPMCKSQICSTGSLPPGD